MVALVDVYSSVCKVRAAHGTPGQAALRYAGRLHSTSAVTEYYQLCDRGEECKCQILSVPSCSFLGSPARWKAEGTAIFIALLHVSEECGLLNIYAGQVSVGFRQPPPSSPDFPQRPSPIFQTWHYNRQSHRDRYLHKHTSAAAYSNIDLRVAGGRGAGRPQGTGARRSMLLCNSLCVLSPTCHGWKNISSRAQWEWGGGVQVLKGTS